MQERIFVAVGQRVGSALVESLKRVPPAKPAWRVSTVLAVALALLIHAVTLAFLSLGIWLLLYFRAEGNWFALLGALILLGIAWLTRPQPPKMPPLLPREHYPALYGLADRIATAMNSRPVAGIAITPDYNASFRRYGWRQQEILGLGLPLFLAAKGQEKVALLAHELAHRVSGDPLRSIWLGSALQTLRQWQQIARPAPGSNLFSGSAEGFIIDIATLFSRLVGAILERLLYVPYALFALLVYRTSQRAEYHADYLAAQVSSTNGVLSLIDKLHLASNFYTVAHKVAVTSGAPLDVYAEMDTCIATLPAREKERLHRASRAEGSRLDATHPPTAHRIEVLQAHPTHLARITLTSDEEAHLERELAALRQPVQRALMEMMQQNLYY